LSSVFYKPPSSFIKMDESDKSFFANSDLQNKKFEELQQIAKNEIVSNAVKADNLLDFDDDEGEDGEILNSNSTTANENSDNILDELNDLFSGMGAGNSSNSTTTNSTVPNNDILGLLSSLSNPASQATASPSGENSNSGNLQGLF
jgi:AP-1 complex subunit beta-1